MIEWEDLALQTAERFGGTMPHPDTAQAVAAVYAKAPNAVERAIDRVANDYAEGNIRSPWGVLKSRVQQITVDSSQAKRGNDADKAIARAEQRVRNELLHYDLEREVVDELFGPRGTLKDHDTPDTRTRMLALWREHRPLGELVEQEADERGRRYVEQRQRLEPTKADTAT
jgi:hypothetical protein